MNQHTQLRMRKRKLVDVRITTPPPDYDIRSYQPGDEAWWADIINASFEDTKWNVETVRRNLIDRPEFDPGGLFFITHQDVPVGTCCAWRLVDKPDVGYVHMLGVLPKHQGRQLGRVLVLHVLNYFKEKGFREAVLDTDDFRLPAIKTYLSLGFEPLSTDQSHRRRWEAIARRIRLKSKSES